MKTTKGIILSIAMAVCAVGSPRLEVREVKDAAIAAVVGTDFECLDLGPMPSPCWTVDGIELCAESLTTSLEVIDTRLGERALSSAPNCISDVVTSIRITFSPPVSRVTARMFLADGAAEEDMELLCWMNCDSPDAQPIGLRPRTSGPEWTSGIGTNQSFCMCDLVGVDVIAFSVD